MNFPTTLLRAFLAGSIAFTTLQAVAQDDPIQTVPQIWFTEGAEIQSEDRRQHPELPKPVLVSKFEDDSIASNSYAVSSEFAVDDDQAIYIMFDNGRLLKHDFIDRVTDWKIEGLDGNREFALSADGKKVAVSTLEHVHIYNTSDGSLYKKLDNACISHCMPLSFTKDSRFIVVGDANGNAHVVEIANQQNAWRRKMHDWPLRNLLFLENGNRRFLVTSDASEVRLFDMDDEEERRRMPGKHSLDGYRDFWVNTISEVPGTNYFVVGGYGDVYILDAAPGTTVASYTGAEQSILRAYSSPDLSKVIGISRDRVIYSWNTENGAVGSAHWIETSIFTQFIHTSISPNGKYTSVTTFEPQIAIPPRAWNRVRVYRNPTVD